MTMPDERYRALINTVDFLQSLLDPKQTPRVPKAIRKMAYYRLKHFPRGRDLERLADACPDILSKK